MLKSIRLQNFFGFQDCTINLEKGANVLVGINGSGKSNFFKAVKLLKQMPTSDGITDLLFPEFGGFDNIFFAKKQPINRIFLTALLSTVDNEDYLFSDYSSYTYSFEIYNPTRAVFYLSENVIGITKNGDESELLNSNGINEYTILVKEKLLQKKIKNSSKSLLSEGMMDSLHNFIYDLKEDLSEVRIYDNINTSKESSIRKLNPPRLENYLLPDGSNLSSLLNDIKLTDKETYNRIVGALKNVSNKFLGIEFKQLSGFIEMWLEEDGLNRAISPIHISDGTLKFLCLIAILYNPNRGSVVCIDEPELGLHPDMIFTLYEAIEFASETSQVIISTHSAHLLDYFELKQIRVFEKDENNATVVKQLEEKEFEGWYEKFYPGQMWRAGNIGGNRW